MQFFTCCDYKGVKQRVIYDINYIFSYLETAIMRDRNSYSRVLNYMGVDTPVEKGYWCDFSNFP